MSGVLVIAEQRRGESDMETVLVRVPGGRFDAAACGDADDDDLGDFELSQAFGEPGAGEGAACCCRSARPASAVVSCGVAVGLHGG